MRIASLSPNLSELIFALGKGSSLVGRSSVCDFPDSVRKVPVVGKFGVPQIEKIIMVKPDYLVVTALKDRSMATRFRRFGIKVLFFNSASFCDYYNNVKVLGNILNCRKKAELLISRTKKQLKKIKLQLNAISLKERPKVFVAVQVSPLMTVGRSSFINNMITYAGGINIGAVKRVSYYRCSLEWLLKEQPDIILMSGCSDCLVSQLMNKKGWKNLMAFKNKKVNNRMKPELLFRLGPRSVEGIEALYQIFYEKEKVRQ
ncbi:MAG: ABC transporter substrate-binding protein [Lentisphaerae bacterium]|nr:ABC transporter substrate-binding protein [Lentisphaerota bacterium]MCP4103729.1 ABC transporter substrate-binding protein [Lentisphaerota bacterium]